MPQTAQQFEDETYVPLYSQVSIDDTDPSPTIRERLAKVLPDDPQRYLESELLVNSLVRQVYANRHFENLPEELIPYATDPEENLMQMKEYAALKKAVDPLNDFLVAGMRHHAERKGEQFTEFHEQYIRDRVIRLIIPKTIAFAGRIIHDYEIAEELRNSVMIAALYVYFVDDIVDRGLLPEAYIMQLEQAIMNKELRQNDRIHPVLSFDSVFEPMQLLPHQEAMLRRVSIDNSILTMMRFQHFARDYERAIAAGNPDNLQMPFRKVARLKAFGSGYDIAIWTALFALHKGGVLENEPYMTIIQNPLLNEIRFFGNIITKLSDDVGDEEEDLKHGNFSTIDPRYREPIAKEWCRMGNVKNVEEVLPKYQGQSQKEYNMQLLEFFMQQFNSRVTLFTQNPEQMTSDQKHIGRVLTRSAVVCYENNIGDMALTA
jgi:hypothetical protein